MFQNPFSFDGRIRRTEFGLIFIIFFVLRIVTSLVAIETESIGFMYLTLIPLLWFLWAQGAKRCHDLGKNGWWQIIPLYGFWLIFQDGQPGTNEYGDNPKGIQVIGGQKYQSGTGYSQTDDTNGGYSGGYNGGHNGGHNGASSGDSFGYPPQPSGSGKSDGYHEGDLYK